ncbi:MAG TPA: serine hydrolase [Thermoanaerobaculia bacterium]|nr:serine hydrolase [Thermoanaerobaculia bacterium]
MRRLLLLLALTLPAAAQLPPDADAYIERARTTWEVPGIAVTVVRDGKVVAAKGYGVRRLGSAERVDENTMFDIASLSKSFTAAAIATLVDEGKMRWDDPVRRWLPYVEFGDSYRTANVTIRDLLSHRVGVEAGNWMFRITGYSTEEVLRRMKFLKERDPFRTSMLYSNVGYTAAGEAAAAAAKMPFVDLVRTRLLEPLGMRDSTVGVEHTLAPNHVSPHERIDGVLQPIRNKKAMNILPANAVNSTAKDLARWLLFSLGDGSWEGKRIVSPESMREMQSPQNIIATTPQMRAARNVNFFAAYGLGWQVMDYRGHSMLWHSGNADGMPVYMCILPVEKIGVAVMLNSAEAQVLHGTIAARILDSLLGLPPQELPPPPNVTIPPDPPRQLGTSPSRPLAAYAGTYNDPLYGDLTITESDGKLVLQFARGEKADLTHWQYDTFRVRWHDRAYEWADSLAAFGLDATGTPRRVELKLYRDTVDAVRK